VRYGGMSDELFPCACTGGWSCAVKRQSFSRLTTRLNLFKILYPVGSSLLHFYFSIVTSDMKCLTCFVVKFGISFGQVLLEFYVINEATDRFYIRISRAHEIEAVGLSVRSAIGFLSVKDSPQRRKVLISDDR
jgi:hypothetical protein